MANPLGRVILDAADGSARRTVGGKNREPPGASARRTAPRVGGKSVAGKTISGHGATGVAAAINQATHVYANDPQIKAHRRLVMQQARFPAKKATGAPANHISLASIAGIPSLPPPDASALAPYATAQSADSIVLSGPGWSIVGLGILDEDLNTTGDGICWMCRDGGGIVCCHLCERGLCIACLDNPLPEILELQLICPVCHRERERKRKTAEQDMFVIQPYEGFEGRQDGKVIHFHNAVAVRSVTARGSSESVLFLVFSLEGLPLDTTPVPLLVSYLRMLFPTNFAYMPIIFNMGSPEGQTALSLSTKALAASLTQGKLCSVQRVFTIVISHTTPDRGDIHYAPNNAASDTAEKVFNLLMPPYLLEALTSCGRNRTRNLLAVLTCGFLFTLHDPRVEMNKWFQESQSFYALLGFEAEKLQPEATSMFLMNVIKQFYYHVNGSFLEDSLDASGLAMHSGVVYLRSDGKNPRRYLWCHPTRAPYGEPLPASCMHCGSVICMKPPGRFPKRFRSIASSVTQFGCLQSPKISFLQTRWLVVEFGDTGLWMCS
ncbi:hypothetical protein B0H11DRAFT_2072005 [Mycena galericulata]|nr:hypothetical protein B0H11DRAFT_2072005 [Mycena galericulata]